MLKKSIIKHTEFICNALDLLGILIVLAMTLFLQIVLGEMPCPLCLLQRIGFFGMALGFLFNLKFGLRPSHYSLVILSGLFSSAVALRQIALHVVPGTGEYGPPIFGFHLYTWSFTISVIIIVITTIMLGIDNQYLPVKPVKHKLKQLTNILFTVFTVLITLNAAATFLECGLNSCPDNPTHYSI